MCKINSLKQIANIEIIIKYRFDAYIVLCNVQTSKSKKLRYEFATTLQDNHTFEMHQTSICNIVKPQV